MAEGRGPKLAALKAQEEQRRLSREQFLTPRLVEKEVPIESLEGTVVIRSMSHGMRSELRQRCGFGTDEWDAEKFESLALIESVVDPKLTEKDLEALREQSATVIDELSVQISLLNMLGGADEAKKD